jgi:hypothetical protein
MRDGIYVSLSRISRWECSCLVLVGACVSGTRVDRPGVSYDDARGVSYWVPEVPAPGSRLIWLISWEYDMKSPWNKSNSSFVDSGAGSGEPWVGRSVTEISMSSGSVERPVQVNYTYLHKLNYQKSIKLNIDLRKQVSLWKYKNALNRLSNVLSGAIHASQTMNVQTS